MNIIKQTINQINSNQLSGKDYDFVIAQLCVLNNKPYTAIKNLIDDMIASKHLQLNALNQIMLKGDKSINSEKSISKNSGFTRFVKLRDRLRLQGKLQGTRGSFAFFIPFESNVDDIFISPKNLNSAMHGDTVELEVFRNRKGFEGIVKKILERANQKIVGVINYIGNNAIVRADDVKFSKDIFIHKTKTKNANEGDKVVVQIDSYRTKGTGLDGTVVEVLGQPNNIDVEVLALIRNSNMFETFPKKVEKQADSLPQEVDLEKYKNRLDLTKEMIFTIDGADARDLDDAISLVENNDGTQTLGVHIADVGEYVKLGSDIDNEAFKRGTSVYFPNKVLPMLPKQLSNGICSLNELENRLALSVFITFNKEAEVVDHKISETIIKSKKRFTYEEVGEIINNNSDVISKNKPFVNTILNMNLLSKKLIEKRENRGAIDFDFPEVEISLNSLGDVLHVNKRERNDAHRLIESFMISANEVIAKLFYDNKVPFIYRIHEKPDELKASEFLDFVKTFGITKLFSATNVKPSDYQKLLNGITDENIKYVISKTALRSLKKAKYYPDCLGHFGLASTYYTHFTSPIRRYPDLTIHRIIKDYINGRLEGKKLSETKHFVSTSAQVSSDREVLAEKLERDVDDLYKVFYMSHHIGEEFKARINSVMEYGVYVELENTVEGLVRISNLPDDNYKHIENQHSLVGAKNTYKIGDWVTVRSIRADILLREIDFELVDNN